MTEHLIAAALRLADVLARENAALTALDLPRAAGMLGEKREAAQAFAELQTAAPIMADHRERLVGPTQSLRALAIENQLLLERAMTVQTRVVGMIARAIRQSARMPCYGATGELAAATRPVALTLSARV